jgi:hypothetical protein
MLIRNGKKHKLPVLYKEDYKIKERRIWIQTICQRKFDTEIDEQILDCIDRELLNWKINLTLCLKV